MENEKFIKSKEIKDIFKGLTIKNFKPHTFASQIAPTLYEDTIMAVPSRSRTELEGIVDTLADM